MMPACLPDFSRAPRTRPGIPGLACFCWWLFGWLGLVGWGRMAQGAELLVTNLAQLRALTPSEIAQAPAVQLGAQITFNYPEWSIFYVTDEYHGVGVFRGPEYSGLTAGTWVEIRGTVGSSQNGANIRATNIRPWLGRAAGVPRVQPKPWSIEQLAAGRADAEWVEFSGVVRRIRRQGLQWRLELGTPAASVAVQLVDPTEIPGSPIPDLINVRVKLVGICTVAEGESGPDRVLVHCLHRGDIQVETVSPVSAFETAVVPLGALPGMADTFEGAHRIRIRGAVTYAAPGKLLYLSDGQTGVAVHALAPTEVVPGDDVEASGFLSLNNGETHLVEAEIRRVGSGPSLPPLELDATTRFDGSLLSRLIRVHGRLVVRDQTSEHCLLTLARPDLDELFQVDVRLDDPLQARAAWRPDSLLEVTGVWRGLSPERGLAGSLLCRSLSDVRIIRPPHWWTTQRLQVLVVSVAGLTLGAVIWAVSLRRQNRAKAEQLQRQIAQEMAVERRYRELFENATDTLLILDAAGTVLDLNPAAELVLGRRSSELMGYPLADELSPEGKLRLAEILSTSPATTVARFELSLPARSDGRVITLEISSCRRLVRASGEQIQIIAHDITERKQAEAKLAELNRQLRDASRRAGRAEVAANVLHNVGNVLNSVNVSTTLIYEGLRESKIPSLARLVSLLDTHRADLGDFFTADPKGVQFIQYFGQLSTHLRHERETMLNDLKSLARNVEHIKGIVAEQQDHRVGALLIERVALDALVEQAIAVCTAADGASTVPVVCELAPLPRIPLDEHRVLQILVNLLRNARQSVARAAQPDGLVTVRTELAAGGIVRVQVRDNGVGIRAEDRTRIFAHGFTTQPGGHGFGLHGSALAAQLMGGSLRAESDGLGLGAVFVLELPVTMANGIA